MESALYLFVLLVAVGIQTSQGELWEVSIYIDTRDYSESNDHLFMDVVGTVSNGSRLYLGNRFRNGETRQRVFNQNYGKVSHIRLYQSGEDGIRVQKVRMESVGGRMYTFRCDCWIQTDQPADDSKPSWLLKSEDCYWNDPIPHCATVVRVTCQTGKCDACVDGYHLDEGVCIGEQWEVSIYIDTRVNAQSNNQLFMDVLGTVSNDSRLYLGNNFRSGEISRKSFMLSRNFGIVNYIRLYQAGDDGLRVRKVRMESESGRMYIFRCDCWIQTDQPANDSRPSWLLQPEDFGQLSLEIGKEWSLLAYELGFSDSQLDHLRSAFPYNIQQCIACMLAKWHETVLKHRVDPLPLLTRSLAGVDRYDLVQKLNSDFDEPDTGPLVNESNGNLADFHATLRKIRFGHIQGDMQMYMDQTQRFLEFQKKDKSQFVNTRAAKEAFNLLSLKGTITLIGNPGDGKSAIAVNLLNQLQNEGLAVLVLSDPALIERIYDDEKQIVYFVDDAFGTPTMNMRLLETWTRLHDKIESLIKLDKCKLLLTSRKHVYMKCQSLLYKCPCYRDNLVDLSGDEYRLSMIEKKRIAANHCQGHGLFPPQLGLTNANVYVPGFPLLCKMFANDKRMQELDVYLDQTLSILHSQLQLLATTDVHAFCGLVLIMMFDGRLPRDVFDQFSPCDEQVQTKFQTILKVYGIRASEGGKVVDCLDEMIGVYVEEIEEEFRFIHDAIFDTICLLFGTRYPNEIIRVASSTFIEKRIRTEHIPDANSNSLADVIILKKSKYHVLAARWIKDASRGIIRAMFINPSIRDVGMQSAFADRVMKLPPQAAMDLLTSVESKTSSTSHFEETVLFLACQNGLVSLVKALMEKQKILKDSNNLEYASRLTIPDICMMESVNRIHLNVVQVLLDNGAMVNFAYGSMCDRCLHVACKKGSLDLVKILLRHGADVNLQDHNGKQAVHFASEFGHLDILKEFGTNNASLSVKDNTGKQAIHYAGKAGSLECVQFLLQEGIRLNVTDRMDKTVLHYASTADYPDLIRHLVSKGAYTNSPDSMGATPLHFACKANLPKNVAILLSNGADPDREDASMCVPLHSVCKGHSSESDGSNSFQCVELLLNVVSDVNAVDSYGKTALHYACAWARDRRLDCVTLLLSKGANPNITDDHGHQPVFYACESGNLKCLQALVNHGIDVNHRGHQGKQPIHYACGRGNIDVVKMLVAKGASITSVDDKGKQPIHYASQHGNDECANYLLDCNIDVNCVDERGWRPLHYACKWCRPNAVRLLMSKGAASTDTDNDNKKPDDLVPNWSSRRSRIKRYLRGNSLDKNAFE